MEEKKKQTKKNSTNKNKKSVTSSTTKKVTTNKKSKTANVSKKTTPTKKQVEKVVPQKVSNKNQNVKISDNKFSSDEIRNLLIIIGAVCAVMLAFYFITDVALKHKKDDEENKTEEPTNKVEPEIQYEQILMGSLLNQQEENYYVLAYFDDEPIVEVYNQYIENYKKTEEPLKVYKVNMSEDFNKYYVADESYLEGNDVSQIKVKETTLIRVSEGYILSSFEGKDEIIDRFNYMLDVD